jgi:hypothetical protein
MPLADGPFVPHLRATEPYVHVRVEDPVLLAAVAAMTDGGASLIIPHEQITVRPSRRH